ncbi:MAG: rRNA maturation RNase YbeY [Lachnospiraceae bacterium]|nr:rRNA maturation RNase YbeY [Lachnospiraceae bacterium]
MTIDIVEEVSSSFDFNIEEIATKVIKGVLEYEKFPYEAYVSLTLVSEEDIHEINLEQRQIDRSTDVLSFPMIPWNEPVNYDELDKLSDVFHPETKEAMLGDIVLCVPKVISQAIEFGHSEKREYAFLIAHSMLHLLGYDHEDEDERVQMEKRQKEILEYIGITRED